MSARTPPLSEQLGAPVAYLALKDGTPVYDRSGKRVGVVEHVIADGGIFEGLVVHTKPLPGRHLYADVDQIAEIRGRGIVLSVDKEPVDTGHREIQEDDGRPELADRVACYRTRHLPPPATHNGLRVLRQPHNIPPRASASVYRCR